MQCPIVPGCRQEGLLVPTCLPISYETIACIVLLVNSGSRDGMVIDEDSGDTYSARVDDIDRGA